MKCKNHPSRNADKFCASCNIPICDDCAEEVSPGKFYCFNCAMLQAVSGAGSSLVDKKSRAEQKRIEKKKIIWGPFQYFVIVSCVLISVMWVVILFGGEKAPGQKIDYAKQGRVLLFMVDSAIRRYHHYENRSYPDDLSVLVPRYLPMRKDDLHFLKRLSYKKDAASGYTLSLATPEPGSMSIILSPKGIKYEAVVKGVE
ncbi:MAG: hypothetical protein JXL81_12420 [Deltaproteobacteria bacterium]|nr:hypothetical protein [Deltaproteobacteria bacterium]